MIIEDEDNEADFITGSDKQLYWEQCMDDLIERWHNGEGDGKELHEFLGFSRDDYNIFCTNPVLFYRSFILNTSGAASLSTK